MESNQDRSIVRQTSRELTTLPIGANRIVGEMVESSLAVANAVTQEAKLDALVQEAKRLKWSGPYAMFGRGLASDSQEARRVQESDEDKVMTPNNIRAYQLFLRAAEAGHAEAQYEVSECIRWGSGVAYNPDEWERWLKLSAEQGYADAQYSMGKFRFARTEEGAKWLRKAAEQGNRKAQMALERIR